MATSEAVQDVANAVLFSDFCALLENVQKKKSKPEKESTLASYIDNFKLNVGRITGRKNSSLFPILRLIVSDKDRNAYNLKEKKLGELLVKVLALTNQSKDAQKLLSFRSVPNPHDSAGDFAEVAYFVIKNRIGRNPGNLTIGDINELLDKIASAEVGNKGPILDEVFSYAIKNLSDGQIKWLLRIILKDLKLGLGLQSTLAAFHPDAPELYNSIGNLSKVCEELEDGNTRPLELGVQIFFAVSPMLSERLDVTHITSRLSQRMYQIESKFDGERFQMHMKNEVFEYFSRKGFTYSDTYGKCYNSGLLTPYLRNCFSASVDSFVLDGEMMGWHKQNQCFGSKGMAFDVKKITENSRFRPCYCVFDLLYYNGKSLVGKADKGGVPLDERLKILETMFKDIPGVIQRSKAVIANKDTYVEDILKALNKAMEDQEEGIVVKDVKSFYIANRRNGGWYKIKPEYTENTMTDLDLVIIGADEAENKRQGKAKSFHVACADVVAPGKT